MKEEMLVQLIGLLITLVIFAAFIATLTFVVATVSNDIYNTYAH